MKILIGLFAIIAGWLILAKQALGFTDTDINTAAFDGDNLIPEYKDPGTRQLFARLANNTAYNNRHSDQMLFLNNDAFVYSSASVLTRAYDTDRDYRNKFVAVRLNAFTTSQALPFTGVPIDRQGGTDDTYLNVVYLQLTTGFQTVIGDTVDERIDIGVHNAIIEMRARTIADGGGIEIRVTIQTTVSLTVFLIGTIEELRQVTGANV